MKKIDINMNKTKFKILKCPCCKQIDVHPIYYRDINDKFNCIRVPDTWFCTYCGFIAEINTK